MKATPREHAFTDVDAQRDPATWVEVLDKVGKEPAYDTYKRRMVELLDPQRGGRHLEVGTGIGAGAIGFAERFDVRRWRRRSAPARSGDVRHHRSMWWLQLVGVIAFAMLLGTSSPGGASVQRWRP